MIQVTLSDAERDQIEPECRARGMHVSTFMRMLALIETRDGTGPSAKIAPAPVQQSVIREERGHAEE